MKHLLVISDDTSDDNLQILLERVAKAEFKISFCSSANVPFVDIGNGVYDIAILNDAPSTDNSLSLVKKISYTPETPQPILILRSSSANSLFLENCLSFDQVVCLTKPIDPIDFISCLNMMLGRRKIGAAYASTQSMLDRMIDESPHPLWISDANGTLVRINNTCCKLLNITEDEVLGKYNILTDNIIIEQGLLPKVKKVYDAGEVVKFDLDYDTSQIEDLSLEKTSNVSLEVTITPIFDTSGEICNAIILHVDKTETRHAIEELRHSEYLLLEIAANIPNSYILILDRDLTITFASGQEFHNVRKEPSQFVGLKVNDVIGEQENTVLDNLALAFSGETTVFIIEKNNQWFEYHISPLLDENGDCYQALLIVKNITERKTYERTLAEELSFQQQLINTIPNPVFYKNRSGHYLGCNKAFLDFFGVTRDQIIGYKVHEFAPKEIADRYIEKDNELWEKPGSQAYEWKAYSYKDEQIKDIIIHKATWNNEAGEVAGIVGMAIDITERKTAEETLRKSEERYKGIIQSTASCIAVYKPVNDGQDFVFTDFNPMAEKVENISKADVLGKKVTEIFPGIDNFGLFEIFQKVYKTGEPEFHPVTVYQDKRIEGFRENYIYKLSTGEIVSVYQDLTEQKKIEQEREKSLLEASQRTNELEALLNGAELILEETDFEVTARHIFNATRELIGAKSGYVALLNKDGTENEVLFLEAGGLSCDVDPLLPMPIRGLRNEVYKTGETKYENDFFNSKWTEFLPEGHVVLENVLFAPLNIRDKTVGVIGIANKSGGFNEDDKRIATAFSQLAAISLKNSRNLEALQESELKHRTYMENAPNGIFIVNNQGDYIDVNAEACKLTGYTREELLSINVKDISGSLENTQTFKILQQTGSTHREIVIKRKDGSKFHATLDATSIPGDRYMAYCADITERKTTEKALQESEENYRLLAENSFDVIWKLDKRMTFTYVSQSLFNMMGFKPEEWVGTPLWKHAKWREFAKMARHAIRTIKNPEEYPSVIFEAKLINVYGDEIPVEIVAHLDYSPNGEFIGLQGSTRDIRERVRSNEALKQSEKRYREAEAIGNVGSWEYDIQTNTLWGSDQAKRIFGFDPMVDTFTLDAIERCILTRDRVHKALVDLIQNKTEYNLQYEIRPNNAKMRKTIMSIAELIVNDLGKPRKVVGIIQDITARIKTEKALKSSESKYKILLENLQQKIFLKDRNLRFLSCNSQFGEDLSLTPSEIIGKTDFDLYPKDLAQKYYNDDLRILKTGESEDIEEKCIIKGEYRWVQTIKTPLKNDDGEVESILGIFWDITDRKNTEEELKQHRENLEGLVDERTEELQRIIKIMAGRELRMVELKSVVKKLREQIIESGMIPVAKDPLSLGSD